MFKKFVIAALVFGIMCLFPAVFAIAADDSELILKILIKKGVVTQQEVDEMRQEVTAEKAKAGVKAEAPKSLEDRVASVEKDLASKVGLEKAASKLKIKGRWAAGYYDSQEAGSFRSGSFEVPEGKIQFGFEPDEINKVIMRMNVNNATAQTPLMDYFYVDSKVSKFFDLPFEVNSRLGRMKLDFGEETWSNNPVESVLASNSAGNVAGSDEGAQLSGKFGKVHVLGWAVSVTNGTSGTGSDTTTPKSFVGKVSYNLLDPLYISGSYYNSGRLKASAPEMSIAGLSTLPSGATDWERQMWEADLRYDFEKGKTLVPAYCDSKAFIRLAYGQVSDDVKEGTAAERDFDYGFVEGTYNITKKIYASARYSIVDLDNSTTTASLNSITANKYQRYSIGAGYRWSDATILKLGYDWNDEAGSDVSEARNDQLSAIVSSQF